MLTWSRVSWTQAEQILALLDESRLNRNIAADIAPKDYFDGLVRSGALDIAVSFLGMALPAYRAVGWASRILAETRQPGEDDYRDLLFAAIERWLDHPDDELRRDLWATATRTHDNCPERLLAGAVYFSGGSIVPRDQAPLCPPPEVCGKLVGHTVLAAAQATPEKDRILRRALAEGERLASAA